MSRPFFENHVRWYMMRVPNVRLREGCDVEGLASTGDQRCVNGIRLKGETVPADLVVDATGRGSHTPQWLETMGYAKPAEERVEIALGYTTRLFHRSQLDLNGDGAVVIPPTPKASGRARCWRRKATAGR